MVYHRDMTKTRKQLVWSLSFFVGSLALWMNLTPPTPTTLAPPPVPPSIASVAPTAATASDISGVWEQYAVYQGHREFMARLDIRSDGVNYVAYPLDLSPSTFPKHAYRSYNHSREHGLWTFDEDWDHGQVGHFVLSKQENGEYSGVALNSADGSQFETVFVRVGDSEQ